MPLHSQETPVRQRGRVLLLNPPVDGTPVLRDFSCADSTKGDYYWAPVDLLVLSGVLDANHSLMVLDAVVEPLSAAEVLERARAFRPDAVFSLTGTVTLDQDDLLLEQIKSATGARIFGLGDVASFAPDEGFANTRSFDAFVQNFADPVLSELVLGEPQNTTAVRFRETDTPFVLQRGPLRQMSYGLPRHDLFPLSRYRMPFSADRKTTTVLTHYGCPHPCTFCNSNKLPLESRAIDEVIEELRFVESLGVRNVYIRDFSFGPGRRRALELCQAIVDSGVRLRWSAECRVELLDSEVLEMMAAAGCEVVLVGIETGTAEVAKKLGKKHDEDRHRRLLNDAHRVGIRVCGHFLVGAPGETREQVENTFDYACSLPIDYASFNLYAPRLGTPMRESLIREGQIDARDFRGQDVSSHANHYSAMDARELQRVFRAGVLRFYFRPRQVARLLQATPWLVLARQGSAVVRNLVQSTASTKSPE